MSELKNKSSAELEALINEAAVLIQTRKKEELTNLRESVTATIKEAGFTVDDVFPSRASSKKKGETLPVKYRDPANTEHTWTGRGRQPRWMKEALDAGREITDLKA